MLTILYTDEFGTNFLHVTPQLILPNCVMRVICEGETLDLVMKNIHYMEDFESFRLKGFVKKVFAVQEIGYLEMRFN